VPDEAPIPSGGLLGGDSPLGVATVLLLIMAVLGYAFVKTFGEKDTALSVVLALVILGCGVLVVIAVRKAVAGEYITR
jgi:hypothetical protein